MFSKLSKHLSALEAAYSEVDEYEDLREEIREAEAAYAAEVSEETLQGAEVQYNKVHERLVKSRSLYQAGRADEKRESESTLTQHQNKITELESQLEQQNNEHEQEKNELKNKITELERLLAAGQDRVSPQPGRSSGQKRTRTSANDRTRDPATLTWPAPATPSLGDSDADVDDSIQDPSSPVRETAPPRGRGRPRKVAGPNKLYPVDAVPTRVLGSNGVSWLPLSSLATAAKTEMDAFNEDAATGNSSWDEYARMVKRGDDEVTHKNPACIYCLVRTKKRSKCNVDETGKTSCSNCINNGVPCCRLVQDTDGELVVGFVPLPAKHRQGKAWREIGYYRLSPDQVRTKPAGKVVIKESDRSKAAKAKASAPQTKDDGSSRSATRTDQRTKSRQDVGTA